MGKDNNSIQSFYEKKSENPTLSKPLYEIVGKNGVLHAIPRLSKEKSHHPNALLASALYQLAHLDQKHSPLVDINLARYRYKNHWAKRKDEAQERPVLTDTAKIHRYPKKESGYASLDRIYHDASEVFKRSDVAFGKQLKKEHPEIKFLYAVDRIQRHHHRYTLDKEIVESLKEKTDELAFQTSSYKTKRFKIKQYLKYEYARNNERKFNEALDKAKNIVDKLIAHCRYRLPHVLSKPFRTIRMLTSNHYVKQANQLFEESSRGLEKQINRYRIAKKLFSHCLENQKPMNNEQNGVNPDITFAIKTFQSTDKTVQTPSAVSPDLYANILLNDPTGLSISEERENFVFSGGAGGSTVHDSVLSLPNSQSTPTGTPPNGHHLSDDSDREGCIFSLEL
ncbi:MAG: hypothetical protein DHS20C10_00900 [marine bacterium B5-7]|nr:MAG: hypothetical protein DHS20C10_00900 [marine bacterium B5-7]